jgi:hypothetical protein
MFKRCTILFVSYLIWLVPGLSQYSEVLLDYDKHIFANNQVLPAGEDLLVRGKIPSAIEYVQLAIYPEKGIENRKAIHEGSWKKPMEQAGGEYTIPLHYRLRPSTRYDIRLAFYRAASDKEMRSLSDRLRYQMEEYLKAQILISGTDIDLDERPKNMREKMESLIHQKLAGYHRALKRQDQIFSDLMLEQLNALQESEVPALKDRQEAALGLLREELVDYLSGTWYTLADERYLDDVPTEDKQGALSINAGYGGIGLAGDSEDDFEYDTSPYVGVSFPFGNSAFSGKFFSNLYLGVGLMLDDLKRESGQTFTGPVVGRPIYASFDYKLFQFVYLNAGGVLLERSDEEAPSNALFIRPFVGLSAKINLSIGFDK